MIDRWTLSVMVVLGGVVGAGVVMLRDPAPIQSRSFDFLEHARVPSLDFDFLDDHDGMPEKSSDVGPREAGPLETTASFTVGSGADVHVALSGVTTQFARCSATTTGVSVFIVNHTGSTGTTNGKGPYCDTCLLGPELPVLGDAWLRTSSGTSTVKCGFVESWPAGAPMGGGGGGVSLGAADARYLKLDASNDPVTNTLTVTNFEATGTTTLGDASGDTVTSNAAAWTFANATTVALAAATPALNFNSGTLAIDTQNGRIGIGTSVPNVKLDVAGNVRASASYSGQDGTQGSPTFTFTNDANSGVFLSAASTLGFSTNSTKRVDISQTAITSTLPFRGSTGDATTPSISFSGDPDTGVFSAASDKIGWSLGGNRRMLLQATALSLDGGNFLSGDQFISGGAGSAGAPEFTSTSDGDTGVYFVAANDLGVSTSGTLRFDVSTAAVTSTLPFLGPAGAVGAPTYSFAGDPNTGVFNSAADSLALATGGTARAILTTSALAMVVPITNALVQNVVDPTANDTRFFCKAGTTTNPCLAAAVTGAENSGVNVATLGGDDVQVVIDGANEMSFDTGGVSGSQVTSGTVHSWRIPTGAANTVPSKPACSASTDFGRMIFLDDTNDAAGADVCVCGKWADDTTFSWASVLHNSIVTGNPSACAL